MSQSVLPPAELQSRATDRVPARREGLRQVLAGASAAVGSHWPEFLMEAGELGFFMVSACFFTAILEHPASPVRSWLPVPLLRRFLTGLAMGGTLLLLIHSRWGKQSGAHMNPAFSLMYLRLGKMAAWDALFYIAFQFLGGIAGVLVSFLVLGKALAHGSVDFATTQPGMWGVAAAFMGELVITFCLATTVLFVSNSRALAKLTPFFAASLVAAYITLEAPFSGMSMNPARTLGSALPAHAFHAIWIYFVAPPLAMLAAAELYLWARSSRAVYCAKLHHHNDTRCIFRCRYAEWKGI